MTKIFCDIADINQIKKFNKKKIVKGFTTNPSLMRKAGAKDYTKYSKDILAVTSKPVSCEVFADNSKEMILQGNKINKWGKNVYVKIPFCNSKGNFCGKIIKELNKNIGTYSDFMGMNVLQQRAMAQAFGMDRQPSGPTMPLATQGINGEAVNMNNEGVATAVKAMTRDYSALMKAIDKKKNKLILTGGYSKFFKSKINTKSTLNPDITLLGLITLIKRNKKIFDVNK